MKRFCPVLSHEINEISVSRTKKIFLWCERRESKRIIVAVFMIYSSQNILDYRIELIRTLSFILFLTFFLNFLLPLLFPLSFVEKIILSALTYSLFLFLFFFLFLFLFFFLFLFLFFFLFLFLFLFLFPIPYLYRLVVAFL